jgi:transcriptional regulator with XRE-family HTH domain
MTFAVWLQGYMDQAELSQSELSRAIGRHPGTARASRQAVNRWLRGQIMPSAASLLAVCDVLCLSADERAEALRLVAEGCDGRGGEGG